MSLYEVPMPELARYGSISINSHLQLTGQYQQVKDVTYQLADIQIMRDTL